LRCVPDKNDPDKFALTQDPIIVRDDDNQAEKYRDELMEHLGKTEMDILLIGGSVDSKIDSRNIGNQIQLLTFDKAIGDARARLNWMLSEFGKQQ